MFPKGIHLDQIARQLTVLADYVRMQNKRGKTDASKLCEDFYCQLFNMAYGYNLINLNKDSSQYPAVDLGDKEQRVSVQVTSEKTTKKVRDTLETFDSKKVGKDFDVVKVFVIGVKQGKYPKTLKSKTVNFDTKEHIFDNDDLLAQTETLGTSFIKKISEYLKEELEMKIAGSDTDPNRINDFDIKYTIDYLYEILRIEESEIVAKKSSLNRNIENFIEEKNKVNLLSESLFSEKVAPSIIHSKLIQNFLTNPINEESKTKYLKVTDTINNLYLVSEHFGQQGIDYVFGVVFRLALDNVDHNKHDLRLLPILEILHNMYFHCDIGKNPIN